MFRVKHYFSIRIVSLLLAIAMIVGVVPVTVIGAINENGNSATIDVLVEGGIVDGDVVVFEDCVINWSPADPSVGRYQDGWWVGIKVTAPSVLDIENATYQNKTSDGWGVVKSFKTYRDSTDDSATQFITLWGMVNEQYLTDAIINGKEFLNYGYRFNWDGVGDYDQEITMKINPKDIILNKNGAQLYPNVAGSGAIATITDGLSVSNNGGNIAVVENKSNIVLNWTEANAEIGRNQDGWWVGFNVTAPDYADLEKATYQYKTSTGWDSEVHSFVPDSGKTLQVWRLLNENYLSNAISANKNVNYITRYDWDGDGVYEQIVHLKVDPRKVELMKDGERVYPQSGAVTPLTGGIVIGSAPNFELRIEETTLNWSAKDESIGRLVDGWWVGFKVTAPDGYTVEQLDSGFYYKRATSSIAESGWGEYQKTYFKDTKDSDREVTLWMVINPSLLEKYEGIGRNICTEYIFDWDGTGNNVQTITLAVVPSEKIVLNKVEQSNFGFVEPNPVDKWVGDTYTNEAVGGQGTGEITYSIEEGFDVADIDSSTGTLTFKKVGTVVVTATKAADDTYKQVSATYTVNAIKYSQSEFKFENSNGNITVEFAEGEYINKAIGGSGDGDVKYSIVSGELVATIDENTGKITFLKAGDVTVVATKLADDKYFETTATYTLTIAKSNQQTLEFENDIPASITYSTDSIKNLFDVIGGSGEGKLVYTIVDGVDYAKIDKDSGAITLLKAGGSFTVQVIKEGDSGYNESAAISAEIRVEYADQKGFVFENQIENSITFNDNDNVFENSAIGGQGNGIVKYAFADEESANIADIDENTGKITIKASGVIKVIASKAGDDCYKEASAAYTLVVEKDDPEFSVENVTLIYGTTEYQITVNSTLVGSGKYAYEIIEENSIGAAVDSDGKITFTNSEAKVGTIKVSVTKEEDNQYKSGTYVFEVSVEYHQPEKKPEISGSTKNESGWFDGEVTITAPDGYTIGLSNDLEGTVWHETVTLCTDGIHLPGVYLKKGNEISDVFTFGDVKIDKAAPINLSIEYEESFFIKFIQLVTFGIFESEGINVKLSALDETSGIDYITYTIGGEDVIVSKDQFDTNENGEIEYNFQIQPQFRDEISFTATDVAGWTSEITSSGMILLVDNISPDLQCAWNFTDEQNNLYNNIYYTQGKTTVKFTITEANFDLSLELAQDETKAPAPIITVNQVEQNVTWSKVEGTDEYEAEIMLTECGDYEIAISYTDRSGNAMETYSQKLHIDDVAPIVEVTYDNNEARNENHYNADRTATIKVTEHNFESQNITLDVTAKDINGVSINISEKKYAEYVQDIVNWKQDGDVWTLNTEGMKFDADAVYNITLNYVDLAGNVAEAYSTEFVVDKTAPANVQIEYSESIVDKVLTALTFGFYDAEVTVTVTVVDYTSGIESLEITYTKEEGTSTKNKDTYSVTYTADNPDENLRFVQEGNKFTAKHNIGANARGLVSVKVVDKAANTFGVTENKILVVDNIVPGLQYEWSFTDGQVNSYNNIYYTQGETSVKFTVDEANFDLGLEVGEDETKAPAPVITVNQEEQNVTWSKVEGTDEYEAEIMLTECGDYEIAISYTDRSGNAMETYSQKLHIDDVAPVIEVTYDNNEARNENHYKADRTATIKVTEHNFKPKDIVLDVTAKDINGEIIDISEKNYAEYVQDIVNWKQDGDVWTLDTEGMEFDADAVYNITLNYVDLAGNVAEEYSTEFVVDKTAPANVQIEYSESIVDKLLTALTFGFYNAEVTVTVTVEDYTSGIESLEITYTKEEGTSDKNKDTYSVTYTADNPDENLRFVQEGNKFTAKHTIDANARGNISVSVTDKAGNVTNESDDNHRIVVDNIAPQISVTYEANSEDTKVQFTDNDFNTVSNLKEATHIYYNGDVTAKIVIDEANFFEGIEAEDGVIHSVGIKLTKTDNAGVQTVFEYLPNGAAQMYEGATPVYITWKTNGDLHSFDIEYSDDADYVLEIEYVDFSQNTATKNEKVSEAQNEVYQTRTITVDKIAPVVEVVYSNEAIINTVYDRDYFDAHQTATITVVEHNFRANDFNASVIAKDVLGNDVVVEDFESTLSNDERWQHNGDIHTITISYTVDANYSFDYELIDLAQNAAAEYETDLFTVDTTAPENLTISYSQSFADKVLEAITFGYYNAKVTVTITAEDSTSGIYRFEYSYLKSAGVSSVNAELLNAAIEQANIESEGTKYIATFEIPKEVLNSRNQFNGTVKFTAFDCSENNTEEADTRRVIVDNITPVATITYNEPVQTVDNISYYAGNIDAKIEINEANFFKQDVVVKVNDEVIDVKWTDNSVDVHTGTFTLTEDGDYIVTVEYTDRSGNKMNKYTSNQLTVDTVAPTVSVTNIKNNSANKDEQYGFTVTLKDVNLDAASIEAILTAVVKDENSGYAIEKVSLGEMTTVDEGKHYTFTVENLEADAVYTLVCSLNDMSLNKYSKIMLDDGKEYDEVKFSINRNGSAFDVDDNTAALVEQYYVYNVENDVVIVEVNVDPVENYTVKLNGEVLTEGTDFTTSLSNVVGEWSKRTYVLSKSLFDSEGEYTVVIESIDKAQSSAYSDVKNLNVSFVVDRTAPVITISGIETGGRYQVDEQLVTIIPTDDGGKLHSLIITVFDSDGSALKDAAGNDISVRFDMSGDELLEYLTQNEGKVTFTIPQGLENNIQIVCNDCAAGSNGKTNELVQTFTEVTVSQSGWIIFYANKALFYGSIAGIVVLIGVIVFLIVYKKKKKVSGK